MGVPPFPPRLYFQENQAVTPARAASGRVHMRCRRHLPPCAGDEFPADLGELLASVEVETNLAVAEKVPHLV